MLSLICSLLLVANLLREHSFLSAVFDTNYIDLGGEKVLRKSLSGNIYSKKWCIKLFVLLSIICLNREDCGRQRKQNCVGLESRRGQKTLSEKRLFMEINSEVKFGDDNLKKAYHELEDGKFLK